MGGACTSVQLRNMTLCSQLNEVHRSLMNLLPRMPAQAAANLRCAASVNLTHAWYSVVFFQGKLATEHILSVTWCAQEGGCCSWHCERCTFLSAISPTPSLRVACRACPGSDRHACEVCRVYGRCMHCSIARSPYWALNLRDS